MFELPIPSTSEEFESLVASLLEAEFRQRPRKVGRRGQSQSGIDYIITKSKMTYGIQCKKRQKEEDLSEGDIVADIDAFSREWVKLKEPFLYFFLLYTTLRSDSRIQKYINEIRKSGKYGFEIHAYFWNDIEEKLYSNSGLLKQYYGKILISPIDHSFERIPFEIEDDPGIRSYLTSLSNRFRSVFDFSSNSTIFDHATLSFANDTVSCFEKNAFLTKYHLSAFDQLLESVVLHEKIYVIEDQNPHHWQESNHYSDIEKVLEHVLIPPFLSYAVDEAGCKWIENFWESRSSKGFLARLLHMQAELALERKAFIDFKEEKDFRNMLEKEDNNRVEQLCKRLWTAFYIESLKGGHRSIPRIGVVSNDDWRNILDELEYEGTSLIYWMFYRTFRYECIGILLGGIPYYTHPLRAATIAFEAYERNSGITDHVLSFIKTGRYLYNSWKDEKEVPTIHCLEVPPISHYIYNKTEGDLTKAFDCALDIRNTNGAKSLRECMSEMQESLKSNPDKFRSYERSFEKITKDVVSSWDLNTRSSINFVKNSKYGRYSITSQVSDFLNVGLGRNYVSFYKKLVDSVRYTKYLYPYSGISQTETIENQDHIESIKAFLKNAQRNVSVKKRKPRGVITYKPEKDTPKKSITKKGSVSKRIAELSQDQKNTATFYNGLINEIKASTRKTKKQMRRKEMDKAMESIEKVLTVFRGYGS